MVSRSVTRLSVQLRRLFLMGSTAEPRSESVVEYRAIPFEAIISDIVDVYKYDNRADDAGYTDDAWLGSRRAVPLERFELRRDSAQ